MEFLLSNLVFILLILYGIMQWLAKRGDQRTQKTESNQQKEKSPFDFSDWLEEEDNETWSIPNPWEEERKPLYETANEKTTDAYENKKTDRPYQREETSPYERPYESPYKRPTDSPYAVSDSDGADNAETIIEVKRRKKSKRGKEIRRALASGEAVQGMVWSEVFGKPRSLNPHRALLYRRRRVR